MDGTKHAVIKTLGGKGGGKGKAHVHSMHIRRADSGGYIVKHGMMGGDGEAQPDQEHVVPDAASLGDHVQAAMGDQPPAQMPAPDPNAAGGGAAPPPQAA